jgi:hypothetical protein
MKSNLRTLLVGAALAMTMAPSMPSREMELDPGFSPEAYRPGQRPRKSKAQKRWGGSRKSGGTK